MNQFTEAVKKAVETGVYSEAVIYDFISKTLTKYQDINRINISSAQVKKRFKEVEDRFLTDKMLDGSGFKYIALHCSDDEHATKIVYKFIKQFNDNIFFEQNPDLETLNREVKELLQGGFVPGVEMQKMSNAVKFSIDFSADLLDTLDLGKWKSKKERYFEIIQALKQIGKPGKVIRRGDLLSELQRIIGIAQNNIVSDSDSDDGTSSVSPSDVQLAKKYANQNHFKNSGSFPENSESVDSLIADAKKHSIEFMNTLTEKEKILLYASAGFQINETDEVSFNELVQRLQKMTGKSKTVLYDYRKVIQQKLMKFIKKKMLSEKELTLFNNELITLLKGEG